MTRDETVTIIRAIKASYPTFKPDNISETVDVWHMMLDDQDYRAVSMALKSYIRSNNSGFAPSIGQLMEYVNNISTPDEMTGMQAWAMVRKAIRNSSYNSLSEFAKLPETIQKALGSPDQLRSMAIDENFNENVASSNFMRSYAVIVNREKELRKMSPDVLQLIETVNRDSPKQLLEQKNNEKLQRFNSVERIEVKSEFVSMPDDVKDKMKDLLGL